MNIVKRLTENTAKKTALNMPKNSLEISAMQKMLQNTLQQNIEELQQFTTKQMPQAVASQKNAIAGLEQLSKNVQSMIK